MPRTNRCGPYEAVEKENSRPASLFSNKEKATSTCKGSTTKHASTASNVSWYPETASYPVREYMTGTRYVARIERLKRTNLCIDRSDLSKTPGKPSVIQCRECGAIIHLGPIDMGINAFAEHLAWRHTAKEYDNSDVEYSDNEDEDD